MIHRSPDPSSQCPRCGAGNQCALADGRSIAHCWCMSEPRQGGLGDWQGEGDRCLCVRCLRELRAQTTEPHA